MKRCTKCKKEKPLEEFYPRYTTKGNVRTSHCKECLRDADTARKARRGRV